MESQIERICRLLECDLICERSIILALAKCDLKNEFPEKYEIVRMKGMLFVERFGTQFMEFSAKDDINVKELFELCIKDYWFRKPTLGRQ